MKRLVSFIKWAWFVALIVSSLPDDCRGQDSVRIVHRFAVPDTLARVSVMLPIVSEYLMTEEYDRWWHEIAECEGLWLPIDYMRVRYFQVNAVHFYDKDHPSLFRGIDGVTYVNWAVGTSYLAEGAMFIALPNREEPYVVKHEMLHFLLYWNGIPPGKDQHPAPYYTQCGMSIVYQRQPPK
jgi:hypothetical protein